VLYNHVTGDYYPRVFPSAIVYIQLHIYLYLFSRDIGVAHDADLLLDWPAPSPVVGPPKSPPPPPPAAALRVSLFPKCKQVVLAAFAFSLHNAPTPLPAAPRIAHGRQPPVHRNFTSPLD